MVAVVLVLVVVGGSLLHESSVDCVDVSESDRERKGVKGVERGRERVVGEQQLNSFIH